MYVPLASGCRSGVTNVRQAQHSYDRVSCLIMLGGQTTITLPTSYCLLKIQYIDSQRPIDCVSFFSVFMRNLFPEKRVNVVH